MKRLVEFFLFILVWGISGSAWATGVTLSVSGNEGWITISGSATFSTYPRENDQTISWGSLNIYRNGVRSCFDSGDGSASCSYEMNATRYTNGTYTFTAIATDSNQNTATETKVIVIDNTPKIAISTPEQFQKVEELFDFTGNVEFKDDPQGIEGTLYYYLDGAQRIKRLVEGTNVSFSYNDDKPYYIPELDPLVQYWWNNGIHELKLIARAANFSQAISTVNFIVGCDDPNYSLDYDGDGIIDCNDACPTVYGNTEDGCKYVKLDLGRDDKDPGSGCKTVSEQGNPTSIYTGNKLESAQDLSFNSPFNGGLNFQRFYNSQSEELSSMGYGCTHNYNVTLQTEPGTEPDTEHLVITDETGFGRYFNLDLVAGTITPLFEERTSLSDHDSTYIWQRQDGNTYTFDAITYQLLHIEDRLGNRQTITYDVSNPQLIDTISDEASGRSLEFSYTDGLITTIRLFSGATDGGIQVTYGHDSDGNLTDVTFADGSGFVYEYDDANPDVVPYINNLTRKSDAAGHMLARWTYDDQDRCDFNETGDGRGVSIDYATTPGAVIVTDAYGIDRTYQLTTIMGRKRIASVTGDSGCSSCIDEPIRWEYDQHLNVVEKEYANGRIDRFANFDSRGNPGTTTQAVGTADEKVTTTTWHPVLHAPLTRTEQSVIGSGSKVTTWDYDDDGDNTANENPTNLVHRIIVSGYSLDASGLEMPVESITKFIYNTKGQLLSVDGPLTGTADTVTFDYDTSTGDLTGQTMPVSGTTSFNNHDAAGRPGRVTDANANSIDYTYDGRGRLDTATRLWDSAVTDYDFNTAGKLDTVTLANGVTYTYQYDAVYGRLETITDALGNTIEHGYDAQGNIIDTGYHLPGGTKTFWQRFDYQYPGRPGKLWKQINPDNSYYEYAYDAVGNMNQMTDPMGKITTYGHDLFNRQTTMVQPGPVTTDYVYEGQGNMVLVTDPESHTTEYVVDDLGRTIKIVSPDSGTSTYSFDAAGNLVSKIDANGITSTYSYDDEYRLTGIQYPDTSQNVTYTYDVGVNGMGRLTSMTDPAGSYVYGWDEAGNLTSEQKTIDTVVYTTGYDYDAAGLLTEMTYPDGLIVTWQRDAAGNVSTVTATRGGVPRTLADTISYLPFGPMESIFLGNGATVGRTFDQQYRMTTDLATGIQSFDFDHDLTGNVTDITNLLDSTRNLTFGYDDLYRVTSATGIYGTLGFGFDDVGNRLSRTDGGSTETYTYTIDTNRLDLITNGGTTDIVIDPAGNTTTYGTKTLSYTQANRLAQVQDSGNTLGEYVYSADDRRMKKTVGAQITVYHYDTAGKLIGESDGQGNLTRLYVYLNGVPLSQITVAGGTESTYYYHNDHLGTPQKLTDSTGAIVWAADYLPFGDVNVTVGTVENNLRFAGQYYDQETGLHYNYFRYYDPKLGRYLRADPIGLMGGANLYSYVQNNPMNLVDPWGLQPHAKFIAQVAKYTNKGIKSALKNFRKNIAEHEAALADPCQKLARPHHEGELATFKEQLKIVEAEAAKRGLLGVGAGLSAGDFSENITEAEANENTSSWFDWIDPNLGVGNAY